MGTSLELQTVLQTLLGSGNVYFQPPPSVRMSYPCIVFKRSAAQTKFADNLPYSYAKRYELTVIASDPDSAIPDKIAGLPMCVFERHFTADQLNHEVFSLYF